MNTQLLTPNEEKLLAQYQAFVTGNEKLIEAHPAVFKAEETISSTEHLRHYRASLTTAEGTRTTTLVVNKANGVIQSLKRDYVSAS